METIRRSRAVVMLAALLAAVVAFTLVFDDPAEARKKKRKRYTTVFVDQIVFASNQNLNPQDISTDMEIFSIKPDGSQLKQLTHNVDFNDDGPVLSPDGKQVAFSRDIFGNREIFVMDAADGLNERPLTNDPGADWTPDWSPDGSKIAYTNGLSSASEIFVMNAADGSGKVNLMPDPNTPTFRPVFSPNGNRVAFTSLDGVGGDFEIYETPFLPEGGSTLKLPITANATDDYGPEYSPDGSKIYYDSAGATGGFEIRATSVDGSRTTINLTNNTTDDLRPSARRAGSRLVYEQLSSTSPNSKDTPRLPGTYTSKLSMMDANGNWLGDIPNINPSKTNQSPDWGGYWMRVRR